MDDDEFKEDDDDIHKVGVQNKNFHLVNKKTYEFKIDYDSSIGYYSTRLSIDLIYLPLCSYTMVYEMYIDDGITIDETDAQSGTLTVGKINSRIDGTKTRSIIHFTKYTFSSGFDDLDIDIKLKNKSRSGRFIEFPQTTIYVVVYGVKGYVNNVSVNLWDRFYYYDNDSVKYEASIDMNKKDITNVNKITTGDLDVNGQTDIKGNKIIGVGNGTANSDAVNKSQLEALKSEIQSRITNLVSRVNTNKADIATINKNNGYYYFTDQLRHNITKVKFPAVDSNPYSANNNSEFFKITLDGYYQIIYTDYYSGDSCQFIIHDGTNGNDLFVTDIDGSTDWRPLTINAVIPITIDNGFGHARIKMYVEKISSGSFNGKFDGAGYSTFYIKYLHALV